MFILDWALDWLFGEAMKFFQTFFTIMGNMGIEIFDYAWVQGIVYFFRMLGWSLYLCGLVVLIFDTAISAQQGRANLAEAGFNALKGFFAVHNYADRVIPIGNNAAESAWPEHGNSVSDDGGGAGKRPNTECIEYDT